MTTTENPAKTKFVTIERGSKYAVNIVNADGWERRILVKKTYALNPSVRGGAYMVRWLAYNGGMNLKVYGDTRQQAVDNAFARLATTGSTYVPA